MCDFQRYEPFDFTELGIHQLQLRLQTFDFESYLESLRYCMER